MNMPGFTAEASLYRTSESYELEAGFTDGTGEIIPQRIKLRTVYCSCDTQTDICVCSDGRVLSNTLGNL
jgi:hypothetical protein